jgi:large subunit ribosomal protein L6
MSRIGKSPVEIPEGVELLVEGKKLLIKGKQGSLSMYISDRIELESSENKIEVKILSEDKQSKSEWGLTRSLINNMVKGVTEGFTKILQVNGVGYRASVESGVLQLQLGYSHDIKVALYQTPFT